MTPKGETICALSLIKSAGCLRSQPLTFGNGPLALASDTSGSYCMPFFYHIKLNGECLEVVCVLCPAYDQKKIGSGFYTKTQN